MDGQSWDRRYADCELVWSADPNQFFAAELADLPAGRALELGTGEGRNAMWLANQGWEVTAVDFSAVAIDKARAIAESPRSLGDMGSRRHVRLHTGCRIV